MIKTRLADMAAAVTVEPRSASTAKRLLLVMVALGVTVLLTLLGVPEPVLLAGLMVAMMLANFGAQANTGTSPHRRPRRARRLHRQFTPPAK